MLFLRLTLFVDFCVVMVIYEGTAAICAFRRDGEKGVGVDAEDTISHLRPARFAVARATRRTIMGRSFLPPAPKIWAAAASMGGPPRLAAMACRFAFINSMSANTGSLMAWIVTGAKIGKLLVCAELRSESLLDVALSMESCTT